MLAMLAGRQLRNQVPRFVWGARFAHETGAFLPFIASDIGIVTPYRGSPAVICFMTQRYAGVSTILDDVVGRMSELVMSSADVRDGAQSA